MPGVVRVHGKLHVFGGAGPDRRTAAHTHWVLDEAAGRWLDAGVAVPIAGSHGFTHAFGGAFCYGGVLWGDAMAVAGPHVTATDCVHAHNATAFGTVSCVRSDGRWTAGAPMPTPSAHFATFAVNEIMVLIGGSDNGVDAIHRQVQLYNTATNRWTLGAPLPFATKGNAVWMGAGGAVWAMYNPYQNEIMAQKRQIDASRLLHGVLLFDTLCADG